jgi:hypothetical protein
MYSGSEGTSGGTLPVLTVSLRPFGFMTFVVDAAPSDAQSPRPSPAGRARTIAAALALATLAACAGGPPEDQIGPPPGMETTPPQAVEAPPGVVGMPKLEDAPSLEGKTPSGFVEMREVEIAFLGAAGGGTGTLSFRGQTYPFEIAGLGGGGAGISKIDASGEVYNLTDVAHFPGVYSERRMGVALGTGGGDLWLQNNSGVLMHLTAQSEGLMLSLGADAVDIRLTND